MNQTRRYSLMSLLLAVLLAVSLAGCGNRVEEIPPEEPDDEIPEMEEPVRFVNPLAAPKGSLFTWEFPNLQPKIEDKHGQNDHTVGWLQMPDTTIDDVVLQSPDDTNNANAFYLRRDFYGNYLFDGMYFVSYASKIDGSREGFSPNTIIFGHSMTDDVNGRLLNQLKKLRESQEFAETHPYLYFSVDGEDLIWEIFAVFDTHTNFVSYINANPNRTQMEEILEGAMTRSYYDYDVNITPDDKILTISTCTYNYVSTYPNDYRYVVMARLVGTDEKIKETATLAVNPDRVTP